MKKHSNIVQRTLRPVLAALLLPVTSPAAVDFAKEIGPIFENRCLECHGPDKQKSGLRLDSKVDAFEEDYIVIPGKAEDSELFIRVNFPEDHDDVMPPEGGTLNAEEIALIKTWIDEGAAWPEDFTLAPPKQPASSESLVAWPEEFPVSEAEKKSVAQLNELGIAVRPIAMNSDWMTANLRVYNGELNPELLDTLGTVGHLVDLNLASTSLDDEGLARLAGLTNLMTLHLENTAVTDAGLKHLKDMKYLNYLNLYGTAVSDTGLPELGSHDQLKKVYLWQTQVTADGATTLREALPDAEINTGEALQVAANEDGEGEDNQEKEEESK